MSDSFFHRRGDELFCDDVALSDVGNEFGTPCFVYSAAAIKTSLLAYQSALAGLEHRVCYAVKANGNLALLQLLADLGAGFDIVSGGELQRVLRAGGNPSHVVFSGVGKQQHEIELALRSGVGSFNAEGAAEIDLIEATAARLGLRAPVSLRVNPDVDPQTHAYISTGLRSNKFGVPIELAPALCERIAASPHLILEGIACHIGSQITSLGPFGEAFDSVFRLIAGLRSSGHRVPRVDLGGGLGVNYNQAQNEAPPTHAEYGETIKAAIARSTIARAAPAVVIEPGRSIVANAGVLLTDVLYLKHQGDTHFAIVDAAMNDLLRPALYQAKHDILSVSAPTEPTITDAFDLVGPICESGDFIAKDVRLRLSAGARVAVMGAGAYGSVMGSNYNARNRPAEVLVKDGTAHLIRRRETVEDQMRLEALL